MGARYALSGYPEVGVPGHRSMVPDRYLAIKMQIGTVPIAFARVRYLLVSCTAEPCVTEKFWPYGTGLAWRAGWLAGCMNRTICMRA